MDPGTLVAVIILCVGMVLVGIVFSKRQRSDRGGHSSSVNVYIDANSHESGERQGHQHSGTGASHHSSSHHSGGASSSFHSGDHLGSGGSFGGHHDSGGGFGGGGHHG